MSSQLLRSGNDRPTTAARQPISRSPPPTPIRRGGALPQRPPGGGGGDQSRPLSRASSNGGVSKAVVASRQSLAAPAGLHVSATFRGRSGGGGFMAATAASASRANSGVAPTTAPQRSIATVRVGAVSTSRRPASPPPSLAQRSARVGKENEAPPARVAAYVLGKPVEEVAAADTNPSSNEEENPRNDDEAVLEAGDATTGEEATRDPAAQRGVGGNETERGEVNDSEAAAAAPLPFALFPSASSASRARDRGMRTSVSPATMQFFTDNQNISLSRSRQPSPAVAAAAQTYKPSVGLDTRSAADVAEQQPLSPPAEAQTALKVNSDSIVAVTNAAFAFDGCASPAEAATRYFSTTGTMAGGVVSAPFAFSHNGAEGHSPAETAPMPPSVEPSHRGGEGDADSFAMAAAAANAGVVGIGGGVLPSAASASAPPSLSQPADGGASLPPAFSSGGCVPRGVVVEAGLCPSASPPLLVAARSGGAGEGAADVSEVRPIDSSVHEAGGGVVGHVGNSSDANNALVLRGGGGGRSVSPAAVSPIGGAALPANTVADCGVATDAATLHIGDNHVHDLAHTDAFAAEAPPDPCRPTEAMGAVAAEPSHQHEQPTDSSASVLLALASAALSSAAPPSEADSGRFGECRSFAPTPQMHTPAMGHPQSLHSNQQPNQMAPFPLVAATPIQQTYALKSPARVDRTAEQPRLIAPAAALTAEAGANAETTKVPAAVTDAATDEAAGGSVSLLSHAQRLLASMSAIRQSTRRLSTGARRQQQLPPSNVDHLHRHRSRSYSRSPAPSAVGNKAISASVASRSPQRQARHSKASPSVMKGSSPHAPSSALLLTAATPLAVTAPQVLAATESPTAAQLSGAKRCRSASAPLSRSRRGVSAGEMDESVMGAMLGRGPSPSASPAPSGPAAARRSGAERDRIGALRDAFDGGSLVAFSMGEGAGEDDGKSAAEEGIIGPALLMQAHTPAEATRSDAGVLTAAPNASASPLPRDDAFANALPTVAASSRSPGRSPFSLEAHARGRAHRQSLMASAKAALRSAHAARASLNVVASSQLSPTASSCMANAAAEKEAACEGEMRLSYGRPDAAPSTNAHPIHTTRSGEADGDTDQRCSSAVGSPQPLHTISGGGRASFAFAVPLTTPATLSPFQPHQPNAGEEAVGALAGCEMAERCLASPACWPPEGRAFPVVKAHEGGSESTVLGEGEGRSEAPPRADTAAHSQSEGTAADEGGVVDRSQRAPSRVGPSVPAAVGASEAVVVARSTTRLSIGEAVRGKEGGTAESAHAQQAAGSPRVSGHGRQISFHQQCEGMDVESASPPLHYASPEEVGPTGTGSEEGGGGGGSIARRTAAKHAALLEVATAPLSSLTLHSSRSTAHSEAFEAHSVSASVTLSRPHAHHPLCPPRDDDESVKLRQLGLSAGSPLTDAEGDGSPSFSRPPAVGSGRAAHSLLAAAARAAGGGALCDDDDVRVARHFAASSSASECAPSRVDAVVVGGGAGSAEAGSPAATAVAASANPTTGRWASFSCPPPMPPPSQPPANRRGVVVSVAAASSSYAEVSADGSPNARIIGHHHGDNCGATASEVAATAEEEGDDCAAAASPNANASNSLLASPPPCPDRAHRIEAHSVAVTTVAAAIIEGVSAAHGAVADSPAPHVAEGYAAILLVSSASAHPHHPTPTPTPTPATVGSSASTFTSVATQTEQSIAELCGGQCGRARIASSASSRKGARASTGAVGQKRVRSSCENEKGGEEERHEQRRRSAASVRREVDRLVAIAPLDAQLAILRLLTTPPAADAPSEATAAIVEPNCEELAGSGSPRGRSSSAVMVSQSAASFSLGALGGGGSGLRRAPASHTSASPAPVHVSASVAADPSREGAHLPPAPTVETVDGRTIITASLDDGIERSGLMARAHSRPRKYTNFAMWEDFVLVESLPRNFDVDEAAPRRSSGGSASALVRDKRSARQSGSLVGAEGSRELGRGSRGSAGGSSTSTGRKSSGQK